MGGVDFVVRNTTVTPDRRDLVDFTTPYLMDGPAVIVPISAGVTDLAGLAGLRIAVVAGTTMEADLTRFLEDAGIVVDVVLTEPPQQPATLVETGDADAYAGVWTQGIVRATQALDVVVIPLAFSEGLAAFTSPTEPEFGAALEEQLQKLIDSGVWATEFETAFGFTPPWTTREMAASG